MFDDVATSLTGDVFEAMFSGWFDYSTGKRKMKCISRSAVPENVQKSDRAAAYKGAVVF